ncbi:MAG: hypothetical protein AB7G93_21420 [Bdellovibrionales bacterium]
MHKLLGVLLASFLVCGCGSEMSRERRERGGLSESEFTFLKELNAVQADNEEAVHLVASFMPMASEKAQKMAALLEEMGCIPERSRTGREGDFTGTWETDLRLKGDNCPASARFRLRYDHATRRFDFTDQFNQFKNEEYAKLNPILERNGEGYIRVEEKKGVQILTGEAHYSKIEVRGIGIVQIDILTNQRYEGFKGGGSVILTIGTAQGNFNASIAWEIRNPEPVFRISSLVVERKVFLELFSTYGLVEIMDRSLEMR